MKRDWALAVQADAGRLFPLRSISWRYCTFTPRSSSIGWNGGLTELPRSARGNTSLESALTLTKDIRHGIEKLGKRMEALSDQNAKRRTNPEEVKGVMEDIKSLLMKIEEVGGGSFCRRGKSLTLA